MIYVMFTCTGTELNALQREHRLSYHGLDESKDSSTNEALIDPDTVESSRYFISQVCQVIQLVGHGLSCFHFSKKVFHLHFSGYHPYPFY